MINKKNKYKHLNKKYNHLNNPDNNIEQIIVAFFCICIIILTMYTIQKETSKEINKVTGNALSRVNITAAPPIPCDIQLKEGLNLVSFFCILLDNPKEEITSNITNLVYIFEYEESSTDKWKSYNPSLPSNIVQDLNTMSRTEGYWVRVSADEHFVHDGALRTPTNVPLIAGWNLAGYPTNRTKDVNESFLSISGNYTEVRAFNANTQSFISHIPPASGGLTQTTSGSGYWINSSISNTWVVDQ